MEIEGYGAISYTVKLAKELHDMGRYDIVRTQFADTLCWDSHFENVYTVISTIFSGFHNDYNGDDCGEELMIFGDDYISRYYEIAWEYGRNHKVSHENNPYVKQAADEVCRWLSFCCSVGWRLLGYTKTRRAARRSKLIVYLGTCSCDCHGNLAYALIQLYKFFADTCADFEAGSSEEVTAA